MSGNLVKTALERGDSDKKLSVADLKDFLKSKGMVGSGDKGMLWSRAQLCHKVETNQLKCEDIDTCPTRMKPAELRKACARAGLSPIGSNDELMFALVDHLMKNKPSATSSSSSSSSSQASSEDKNVAVARLVLEMCDEAVVHPICVLQLVDPSLTAQSATSALRKAYLKLSLSIHPDRIGRSFDQATKAFQILVTAFEQLTEPEMMSEGTGGESAKTGDRKKQEKTTRISRSNEGCYRTKVCCPRCKEEWTTGGVEGNPDWYYNIFMTGLKSFTCATCLCLFGCMTAIHKCPHCNGVYEYSPQDFHRKVNCGCSSSKKPCNKTFGFYLYHISPRNEDNLRQEIKKQREARAKLIEASKRRNKSAQRRQVGVFVALDDNSDGGDGDGDNAAGASHQPVSSKQRKEREKEEEQAFVMRLSDVCPRCGLSFLENAEFDAPRLHLEQCNNVKVIKANEARKEKEAAKLKAKELLENKQEDAEAMAAWQFLGSKTEQLWLLSEDQLEKQCKEKGLALDTASSSSKRKRGADEAKNSMIAALVKSTDIVLGGKSQSTSSSSSGGRLTTDNLPDNWTQLSLSKLKTVLACVGFVPSEGNKTKDAIIAEVEALLCGDEEAEKDKKSNTRKGESSKQQLLLGASSSSNGAKKTTGKGKGGTTKKRKNPPKSMVVEISSDSDSEFELED